LWYRVRSRGSDGVRKRRNRGDGIQEDERTAKKQNSERTGINANATGKIKGKTIKVAGVDCVPSALDCQAQSKSAVARTCLTHQVANDAPLVTKRQPDTHIMLFAVFRCHS
jgi:hypothetical protein